MTKRRVTPDMYALSTLIFVAILVLLVVSNIISARGDKKLSKEKGGAKK
jgi:spermidine/putrescine transport system permease protein